MSDEEDCASVIRATRGDHESWGQLYDRHAPGLLNLGMRLLAERSEAEDVLHAVFIEAWHHAGQYDPARGTVRAWLAVRMRARCRDRQKSSGYACHEPLDQAAAVEGSAPEQLPDALADAGRARDYVQLLAPELQEVVVLGYFAGLSGSEIAERLSIPLGTVKSRVSAGLTQLRRLMKVPARSRTNQPTTGDTGPASDRKEGREHP